MFFNWLDYSETEKQKMLDVIKLFSERETRDEIGIGTIRDAIADILFPGTSTIQSRAKYFLFVPWIYLDLERRKVPAAEVSERMKKAENRLMEALEKNEDHAGNIGEVAREYLKRFLSNIYWNGLETWGIRLCPFSQEGYHRSFDYLQRMEREVRNDDDEGAEARGKGSWHGGIPGASEGFPNEASFVLSREEAEYLRERLLAKVRKSLLCFLVDEQVLDDNALFPWELDRYAKRDMPEELLIQLDHAQNFSDTMHGAALLYNLLLSEAIDNKEWIEAYRGSLAEWAEKIRIPSRELKGWDWKRKFWQVIADNGGRIPPRTQDFVKAWLTLVLQGGSPEAIVDNADARRLIRKREEALKKNQARLINRRALELWRGEAGAAQLSYRWQRPVSTMLHDIISGLRR